MKQTQVKVVVAYDDKIVKGLGEENVELHTHEEADTLIAQQVLECISENQNEALDIDVSSPDTDVLTYCVDTVANGYLKDNTKLRFITGKDKRACQVQTGVESSLVSPSRNCAIHS